MIEMSLYRRVYRQKNTPFAGTGLRGIGLSSISFNHTERATALQPLKSDLDGYQVYSLGQIDDLVELYLSSADRDKLDPILDACVATYNVDLDEDSQVDFKGKAKAFVRTYGFLSSIGFYPEITDGCEREENCRSRFACLRRILGLWNRSMYSNTSALAASSVGYLIR